MRNFNVVIVSPAIRLAPKNLFPTPLDDCWDTLLWTLQNQESVGFASQTILLAASSAGGSLTSALGVRVGNAMAGDDFGSEVVRKIGFGTKTKARAYF